MPVEEIQYDKTDRVVDTKDVILAASGNKGSVNTLTIASHQLRYLPAFQLKNYGEYEDFKPREGDLKMEVFHSKLSVW